jgi:hypothetical protein
MSARRSYLGRSRLLGIAAAALFLLPAGVTANPAGECVVTVQGTHTTYASVQAAHDAAAPGAMLVVRGTCDGETVVSKDVTIRGGAATLRGSSGVGFGPVLTVSHGATLRLEGLTVTGSLSGGILNEGTLLLTHSTLISLSQGIGSSGWGGMLNNGNATVRYSLLDQNFPRSITNTGTLLVQHSTLSGSSGRHCLGLSNSGTATLEHTRVIDNPGFIPLIGGGICNSGDLTLRQSEVSRNTALQGGGIWNQGTARIIHSIVTDNRGTLGGGIFNGPRLDFDDLPVQSELLIVDSVITGNTAGRGGGIYNRRAVTLGGNTRIGANAATDQGGGIFNESGATVVGITSKTFRPPNMPDDCSGC